MTDPMIVPIIVALIGVLGALVVAGVALFVGLRSSNAAMTSARAALRSAENAGTHRIAQSRQEWINHVTEVLSEYLSIALVAGTAGPTAAQRSKLEMLRAKLEILLNPTEKDPKLLLREIDKLRAATDDEIRLGHSKEVLKIARRHLKSEWARIKSELGQHAQLNGGPQRPLQKRSTK